MRNLKTILPMLAFVLAIGMSFAFVSEDDAYFTAYVNDAGTWTAVNVNCPDGNNNCTIQFVDKDGNALSGILDVYPIPSFVDEEGDPVEPLKSVNFKPELIVIQE